MEIENVIKQLAEAELKTTTHKFFNFTYKYGSGLQLCFYNANTSQSDCAELWNLRDLLVGIGCQIDCGNFFNEWFIQWE